jgi:radical SAM enzyme (rSAM/lipoprotein system)
MQTPIPLKTKAGLSIFRAYRAIQTHLHELNYLFWECTLRCNLNCMHCGSDCVKDSAVPDMPLQDFLKVLDEIAPHCNPHKTIIAVTGGEPLMRKDLAACGKEFYKRGFPWGMVSNGYLLDAARFNELLNSGLRSITISLDGLQDSHTWLRGKPDSFNKALAAIQRCAQTDGLVFDVVTCVNQKNLHELDALAGLLKSAGVKKWRLFTIFPKGRAANIDELRLSKEDFRQLMAFIEQCRNSGSIEASYGCEGFLGAYEGRVRDSYFFCRAGISIGSVLVDGSISACPSLRDDYIQGNIYKDSFTSCWNSRFDIMRKRSWTKTGICETCDVYSWCNGNGLHLRNEKTGELLMCHYDMLNT